MNCIGLVNLLVMIIACSPCFGQLVKTKDSVSLGGRDKFIFSCTQSAEKNVIKVGSLELNSYEYCSCLCDNLIPNIYSWEIEEAIKEKRLMDLFLSGDNLEIMVKCFEGNARIHDDYRVSSYDSSERLKKAVKQFCINEIMKSEKYKDVMTDDIAKTYCDCAIDRLLDSGYTYKDITQIDNENSLVFNEVAVPCISEAFRTNSILQPLNSYNIDDIVGDSSYCKVPLVDYFGKGYKIKINISGIVKYYLFDTGASDMVIDSETERELLLTGVLRKENYLHKLDYSLANNQSIRAQLVKLDNLVIGDYTVNNVVIAIVEDGALLCGRSFLEKFKAWEVDKENKLLILYK